MRVSNNRSIQAVVCVKLSIGKIPDKTISDLSIFRLGMTRPGPSTNVTPVGIINLLKTWYLTLWQIPPFPEKSL